jgi:FkbM family methyltransferase
MNLKDIIRNTLQFLHLDITKNIAYDRMTNAIMKKVIQKNSNCIDVGCHKGEIMRKIWSLAPRGTHYAFEPIPYMFDKLLEEFGDKIQVLPYALSNDIGAAQFQWVKNAPAYSGLRNRKYAIENPDIETIHVKIEKLDHIIPESINIDFIKIDVEGGEFDVLKGGIETLKRCKPIVIFEFGLGSSEFYDTKPNELFDFCDQIGYKIYKLQDFLNDKAPVDKTQFEKIYEENSDYYYVIRNIFR